MDEDENNGVVMNPDVSEDDDSDDEVSLLVVDEDELNSTLEKAGIQVQVDDEGSYVEVSVLSADVSTFLMFAPEEEYLGAKVTGFVPREDGGLSALEMHGQLLEGDVLTHLNGRNARLLDFSDILKACRGPERGGLPRPLVMKFSRGGGPNAAVTKKAGMRGGGADGSGATSGGSSLLAELDDFMGGLTLPGGDGRVPGVSHIKEILRTELQAQGMLGGGGGGGGGDGEDTPGDASGRGGGGNTSPPGEGLFLNILRRLEHIDVAGELSPRAAMVAAGTENGGGDGGGGRGRGGDDGDCIEGAGLRTRSTSSRGVDHQERAAAGGVGSSFAGVGAKLRSKFRKQGSGFGLTQGSGGRGAPGDDQTVGGAAEGVGDGGKAFVEGASKALAANRERVMGWMKELRPKDWSPKEVERKAEEESIQELRRAVRRIYLDSPDPAIHTAMVVARARPSVPKAAAAKTPKGEVQTSVAAAGALAAAVPGVDRVIGTGADRQLAKLVWFRSSGGGFAEIKGVEGPYYQLSADDIGTRICIKCTLAGGALNFGGGGGGSGGLSPVGGKGRRGRHARGGDAAGSRLPQSPQRHQAQVTFAEVGPIILDSSVGAEVDQLLSAEGLAAFGGLVRRDTPGETVRVRVEIGREQVRVLEERGVASTAAARDAVAEGISSSSAVEASSPGAVAASAAGTGQEDSGGVEQKGSGGTAVEDAKATDVGKPADSGGVKQVTTSAVAETGPEAGAVVLAEGMYSSGVLVALDPARPTVLKLTIVQGKGRGEDATGGTKTPAPVVLLLAAVDGRQRDVLALTLRGRRQAALDPEVAVDDFPEETKAQQAQENYLELKAAAAHFARAYDDDSVSTASRAGSSEDGDGVDDEELDSGSYYDTSDEDGEDTAEDSSIDGEGGGGGSRGGGARHAYSNGGGSGGEALAATASRGVLSAVATVGGSAANRTGAVQQAQGGGEGGVSAAAPWDTSSTGGGGVGGVEKGSSDEPRSLSALLEDLRQARAIADSRGRQLKEAHSMWEAGEASRERAEAELRLVSSELDLLRPFSRSLAARAEGVDAAEARVTALAAEVETLKEQLVAAVESAEKLGSRAGKAEEEAGASSSKLIGLEKVVRRLGGEAEVAHSDLAKARTGAEEAMARASKAERELDQARARAAVLDNKLSALEKEKLELLADANASKARASALEEKFSAARVAQAAESEARASEFEEKVSSLEAEKTDAVSKMEEALSKMATAEAEAEQAIKAEGETRAEMAGKTEEVMRLTAQRNSAKSRADSLAKDLSRVCGGGRTLDQIEVIVTRYADLKVKMAAMEAEKDGAADLHDEWPSDLGGENGKGGKVKVTEAAKRALRENTELHGRVAALAESVQMKEHQLEGQRLSNEFLLKRVEELEQQVATTTGKTPIGTD